MIQLGLIDKQPIVLTLGELAAGGISPAALGASPMAPVTRTVDSE
jgi:hypothetical protein